LAQRLDVDPRHCAVNGFIAPPHQSPKIPAATVLASTWFGALKNE